jgi:hypothetical protein
MMSGSDFVFNVAKGKIGYYLGLPAASDAIRCLLLKSTGLEADATLADYDTVAALLAAANDECDFTNYARQALSTVSWTVDDVNDRADGDADDISFATAGGATNNTIGKLVIYYDPDGTDTDANNVPLTAHDYDETTTGSTLNITLPSGGFVRAA